MRDGDTIVVAGVPVRLRGLRCPEFETADGEWARRETVRLVASSPVSCVLNGEQTYDRKVGWAGNVVGSGLKPSSLIHDAGLKAEVQRLWLDWTDEADAEGFTDFYGLKRRVAREVFLAGEVFLRFRPRRRRRASSSGSSARASRSTTRSPASGSSGSP